MVLLVSVDALKDGAGKAYTLSGVHLQMVEVDQVEVSHAGCGLRKQRTVAFGGRVNAKGLVQAFGRGL